MPAGWEQLTVKRVNRIMQTLRDRRTLPQALKYLQRTPVVPATDGEILGRFEGNVLMADIIGDDAQAVVRDTGKLTFEQFKIPNIKHGVLLTQEMLNLLARISAAAIPSDLEIFDNYRLRKVDDLLLGVRQRMNAMICAMRIDAFSYDRLGMRILGATWGMPAALKVTPTYYWTDSTNGTPITNIEVLKGEVASEVYGEEYDRLEMSSRAFRAMVATAEFKARAQLYYQQTFPAGTFPGNDMGMLRKLAEAVTGMTIEIDDSRAWTEAPDGTLTSAPYLPANKVVLSSTADDNDPSVMDFANGVVTESIVSSLTDVGMIGSFSGPEYGPVAYATPPGNYNPPNLALWGVARGFPRKHRLSATAVITVAPDGTWS